MSKSVSIGKPEKGCINEDAVMARDGLIAVSDGAGGGGLFAERWAAYLLEHLPDMPICSVEELDKWIGDIWETFYNRYEEVAKSLGGLSLDKFYDEGSFATLAVVWRVSGEECRWMSFGDSVAFHYNYTTQGLEHSFGALADFDKPPYLINCKDELEKDGFNCGIFHVDAASIVFVASDALAHYILMMYEIANKEQFARELHAAEINHSKNENYIRMAKAMSGINFEKDVLEPLVHGVENQMEFRYFMARLIHDGLLAYDDYSLALLA